MLHLHPRGFGWRSYLLGPPLPVDRNGAQESLPISSTKTRRGMNAAGEDFAAFPALIRDTVVFVPYALTEFGRLSARQTAAQQAAALSRNLDVLLDFAKEWTRDAPQNAGA